MSFSCHFGALTGAESLSDNDIFRSRQANRTRFDQNNTADGLRQDAGDVDRRQAGADGNRRGGQDAADLTVEQFDELRETLVEGHRLDAGCGGQRRQALVDGRSDGRERRQ